MLTPRLGLPTLERIPLCSIAFSRLLHWREISHVTLRGCNSNLVRHGTLRHETFRFSLVSTITHISMFKEFQYTLYMVNLGIHQGFTKIHQIHFGIHQLVYEIHPLWHPPRSKSQF